MLGHAAVNGFKATKLRWKWIGLCITNYHLWLRSNKSRDWAKGKTGEPQELLSIIREASDWVKYNSKFVVH